MFVESRRRAPEGRVVARNGDDGRNSSPVTAESRGDASERVRRANPGGPAGNRASDDDPDPPPDVVVVGYGVMLAPRGSFAVTRVAPGSQPPQTDALLVTRYAEDGARSLLLAPRLAKQMRVAVGGPLRERIGQVTVVCGHDVPAWDSIGRIAPGSARRRWRVVLAAAMRFDVPAGTTVRWDGGQIVITAADRHGEWVGILPVTKEWTVPDDVEDLDRDQYSAGPGDTVWRLRRRPWPSATQTQAVISSCGPTRSSWPDEMSDLLARALVAPGMEHSVRE